VVETIAISTGPNEDSDMRRRMKQAFERFIDVRQQSDEQVARMLREMRVDVVVDLAGHTKHARPGILARRPAPVQVSYLGYPGTTGANYYDYVVADATVIPPEDHRFYSEAVMTLPNSYQANDASRHQARLTGSREAHGLPEDGFVFCAFCATYKITPAAFDIWMRLLTEVEGSVLWLLDGGPAATANLKREAAARGVSPDRLVFAPRTRMEDHIDRHRHADLFLDTLIYNGHTTVSDALWAGLPVVTCPNGTFASRVAASLLKAAHMPELITDSLAEYESLALELARDPVQLSALKRKVVANRPLCPLFKTQVFAKQFQAGLIVAAERARRGQKPEGFAVESMDGGGR
jgi:predicted O-linked N-acetylglucosamine transferase (SPINDLY family)